MCMNLSDVVPTQTLSELSDEFTDEAESMLCEDTQDTLDTVESIEVSSSLSVPLLLVSSKHTELVGSLSFSISLSPGPSLSSPAVFTVTMLLKQDNNLFFLVISSCYIMHTNPSYLLHILNLYTQ